MARCAQLLQECLGGCTTPGSAAAAVCTVTGSPGCSVGPPAFPFPLPWSAPMSCYALRCTQGTWTQGSNVWQAKGPNAHFSPGLAKEDAGVVPGCLGLWPYWGRDVPLCASAILASIASQASRSLCRRVEAEVRASRDARGHNGSAGRSYSPRTATTTRASSPMDSQPV